MYITYRFVVIALLYISVVQHVPAQPKNATNTQQRILQFEGDDEQQRFDRMKYYAETRRLKNGEPPPSDILLQELESYERLLRTNKTLSTQAIVSAAWKSLGPDTFARESGVNGGTGRVNVIAFQPGDTSVLFVGTPDGGIWKSPDEGATWIPLSDNIPSLGVTDIAIDPRNPQIIYIATGDARAAGMYGNPYSYGILKSTDGGKTWAATGIAMESSEQVLVNRVVVSPDSSNIVLAGVYGGNNRGIQRSTDGGRTFSQRDGGSIYDIQYCPDDPSLVYASGYGNFRRSTDGGISWTTISSVLPTWQVNGVSRTRIAVTPADPKVVYVIYISHSTNQVYGLYRSDDRGLSFRQVMETIPPTVFGNFGEYNLALAASTTNADLLIAGEQTLGKSTNQGKSFQGMSFNIHWDNHSILFAPRNGDVFYVGCDGGVYKTTNGGMSWENRSSGLIVTQYYRLGNSAMSKNKLYCGAQDNGVHRWWSAEWEFAMTGADGAECLVDYSDENTVYMEFQNGSMFRWTSSPPRSVSIAPDRNGHWITPIVIHPTKPATLYTAYRNVFRTENRGDSWASVSTALAGADNFKSLAVAPSNDSVIYAGTYIKLFRTLNGGSNWDDITSGSPASYTAALTYIAVSPQDPRKVWITFSGFTKGEHVYKSTDAGSTWTNYTGSLPNVPVNTVAYEPGSNDGVYIGTDLGVFYRDTTMSDWVRYSDQLPNVSVSELEIGENKGVVRAATFGRGLWESPLRNLTTPPQVQLRLPAQDARAVIQTPEFVWTNLMRTASYSIEIARDSLFSSIVSRSTDVDSASFLMKNALEAGTRYYWRVRGENAAGSGLWSSVWSFVTEGVNGVEDSESAGVMHLRCSPMPASDVAHLEWNTTRESVCSVELYSLQGQLILVPYMPTNSQGKVEVSLSTRQFHSGVYVVKLRAGNTQLTIPLVVLRD